jgi:hypothetical protein
VVSLVRALRPTHEVGLILRVLGVSRSTYYHWQAREDDPSRRAKDDLALLVGQRIKIQRDAIEASLRPGISNGLIEPRWPPPRPTRPTLHT